jgi:small subunit ribosomal protein S16
MLRIKLARFGKKNQPHYRIVVTERKSKRDGQYQAQVGTYVPTQTPKILEVDIDAFNAWIVKGAQPTDTVKNLVDRFKSGNPFPVKKARPSKKAMAKVKAQKAEATTAKEAAAQPKPVAATPEAPEAVETPAAEVPEAPAAERSPADGPRAAAE